MSIHYNAFISYRHHPDDIKVASSIHKSLEHYHVPKSIRSKTKGIERIFRDKEELPITSNLTDDITEALKNSDYLIVICSEHTKESIWVQREIETFLQTHPKNKVLTVLASGEPYDTIPEILQYEELKDPSTGEITRKPIEPLSCDWRQKKRKAIQEELPRLASALLGCGYDELRQRLRQYRMRRTIGLFSGALAVCMALTGYFIYTSIQIQQANQQLSQANQEIQKANDQLEQANIEIQNNLNQALINQSKFLASASEERMSAGDRLTAITLALAALPTEETIRPYVADAEYALAKAAGLYQGYDFMAVAAISPGALIRDYRLSQGGDYLYVLDSRNIMTIWDTNSFLQVKTFSVGFQADSFLISDIEHIIFADTANHAMVCMDSQGNVLWRLEHMIDYAVSNDTLYVLEKDYSSYDKPAVMRCIRMSDGADTMDPVELPFGENHSAPSGIGQTTIEQGQPIILKYYAGSKNEFVALDMESETIRSIMTTDEYVLHVSIASNGNILFMIYDSSSPMTGIIYDMTVAAPTRDMIQCYHADTLEFLWEREIISYLNCGLSTLTPIPGTDNLFCQKDDGFYILSGNTGEILSQCQAPSLPISAIVDDTRVRGVLADGSFYVYSFEDNSCSSLSFMEGELNQGYIDFDSPYGATYYVSPRITTQIYVYRYTCDDTWTAFTQDSYSLSTKTSLSSPNYLAQMQYNNTLYILNLHDHEMLTVQNINGTTLIAFSEDESSLWIRKNSGDAICVDTATGLFTEYSLPVYPEDSKLSSGFLYTKGILYYTCSNSEETSLCSFDPKSETGKVILTIQEPNAISLNAATKDFSIVTDSEQKTLLIRHSNGEQILISDTCSVIPAFAANEENKQYAVASSNTVNLLDSNGNPVGKIDLQSNQAISLYYYEDTLYVLCDDGLVYRYTAAGQAVDRIALDLFDTFFSKVQSKSVNPGDITWTVTPNHEILLTVFRAGNLINHESGGVRGYILNCYGYDAASDFFLVSDDRGIGSYPRRDTQQVIAIARDALNGFTLTQEQKDYYGIS